MTTKDVIRAARERLNVEALTPMQHKMAGLAADTGAVALIAPTGSGKTLAFALALLERVNGGRGMAEALVISPTRELTLQIAKTLNALAPALRVVALYGGHSVLDETRSLEAATPDIVVGTPGRILDHINRERLDLYRIRVLVADEYDKSLELGFQDEMRRIVRRVHAPKLVILTSATRLGEFPEWLGIKKLTTIDYTTDNLGQPKLSEYAVRSPEADKLRTLSELLLGLPRERTIVFVNYRESAERVFQYLRGEEFPVILYHGALDQQDRETAIDLFTNGSAPVMVATDLAARGLDIPQVRNVVHYHPAPTPETVIHRNGRAARMGAGGDVYYLLSPTETSPVSTVSPVPAALAENSVLPRTLFFHAGRKEKLSKGDIVGALTGPGGLTAAQIGLISLHDHRALAAVSGDVDIDALAASLNASRIKNRRIRVTPLRY